MAKTAQASKTVTSRDGTPIAYWQSGRGDPVVLVHGTTSDHTRWEPLRDLLEPYATVCAMDRRGRGGSGDAEGFSIELEFHDVAAVVDAVAQEFEGAVDVFGHSYGALCALEATSLTSNVCKLAVYEPPTNVELVLPGFAGLLDRLDDLVADGRREEAVELFFREAVRSPGPELGMLRATPTWAVRVANAHTMVREARAIGSLAFDAERFASLSVATLLLVGGDQPPRLRASMQALADVLPHGQLRVLDGQQHMAMDTAPQALVDALLEHFGRLPAG